MNFGSPWTLACPRLGRCCATLAKGSPHASKNMRECLNGSARPGPHNVSVVLSAPGDPDVSTCASYPWMWLAALPYIWADMRHTWNTHPTSEVLASLLSKPPPNNLGTSGVPNAPPHPCLGGGGLSAGGMVCEEDGVGAIPCRLP